MPVTESFFMINYYPDGFHSETIMNPDHPEIPLFFPTFETADAYAQEHLDVTPPAYYSIDVKTFIIGENEAR